MHTWSACVGQSGQIEASFGFMPEYFFFYFQICMYVFFYRLLIFKHVSTQLWFCSATNWALFIAVYFIWLFSLYLPLWIAKYCVKPKFLFTNTNLLIRRLGCPICQPFFQSLGNKYTLFRLDYSCNISLTKERNCKICEVN